MYERKCIECNTDFVTKYREVKFCSLSCSATYNKRIGIGTEKCLYCDVVFIKKNSKHLFCSRACKNKYSRENDIILIRCSWCDEEFEANKKDSLRYENHFCSRECESNFRISESSQVRICENCEKEFSCKRHDKLRFCSFACQGAWQSRTRVGKNSSTYNHNITDDMRVKDCEHCGKEMLGTPKQFENKKYCSVGCRIKSMNKTLTTPHVSVIEVLEKNKISFSIEYSIKRFSIDCFIYNNTSIEIMGTYWHCDPRFYKSPVDDIQRHSFTSDNNKRKLLESLNIPVLYLWEYDIKTNIKMCEKLILKFVKSNGTLINYHSMNYSLYGNGVGLNDKVLVPRFEK